MPIKLATTILTGESKTAPGIDGDGLFGGVAVWADAQTAGTVLMASSGTSYEPQVLDPGWTSFDTPAVAIATDWETVFVAFVGYDGYVHLASSGSGWTETQTISQGNIGAGPALAYSGGLLYIAWQTAGGQLAFATMDQGGQINYFTSDVPLTSRPTICIEDPKRIYVLCGGALTQGAGPLTIYLSIDGGSTFSKLPTQPTMCFGPPSLAILDQFYLAWADGQSSRLRLAQTSDLSSFTPMNYDVGCHGGGPALIPIITIPDPINPMLMEYSLFTGWTIGSGDSNNHRVAVGSFGPLPIGGSTQLAQRQQRRIEKLRAPRAPACDSFSVYDPATGKCVPKGGCWGKCVLSSFTASGLFNPIAYAVCVARCLNRKR